MGGEGVWTMGWEVCVEGWGAGLGVIRQVSVSFNRKKFVPKPLVIKRESRTYIYKGLDNNSELVISGFVNC